MTNFSAVSVSTEPSWHSSAMVCSYDKVGVTLQNFTVVALVRTPVASASAVNHAVGVIENIGKGGTQKSGVIAVERVLVEFNNAADGMAERFRRDSAPMGTTAADVVITLDNGDTGS